jgi:hypothetical protein
MLSKKESEVKVWLMSSNVGHHREPTGTRLKLLVLMHLPDYGSQPVVIDINSFIKIT